MERQLVTTSDPVPSLPLRAISALIEASASINHSLEFSTVLGSIAEQAARVMDAEAASVLMLDRRRRKLVFTAATGESGARLIGTEFDAQRGIAGKVIRTGQPTIVDDVSEDKDFFGGIDAKMGFRTRGMIAAPLIYQGEVLGVVEVLNKRDGQAFEDRDLDLLRIFANLAANGARNAYQHERVDRERRGLLEATRDNRQIIGHSAALEAVQKLIERVAPSNATVLLLGETGTGKEVTARRLHELSPRRDRSFIAINCAALPETLLESELFGHEKGSFTGAIGQKQGRFELADGGTLFLDEIGDISAGTQVKLLRVLQEKEFVRVGGTKTITTDVRIIAATNRDLRAHVAAKTFREDLFYRLNVFPIQLPPLRQRRDDIPLLVDYFVNLATLQLGSPRPTLGDDVISLLVGYSWPGNIRELQNVIERAVLLADGHAILPAHLPREIVGEEPGEAPPKTESSLWGYEKAMIIKALRDNGWNVTKAARALGISRDNLRYRVKKYQIEKPRPSA